MIVGLAGNIVFKSRNYDHVSCLYKVGFVLIILSLYPAGGLLMAGRPIYLIYHSFR